MTTTTLDARVRGPGLWGATPWHRPLLLLTVLCALGAAATVIGLLVDPRVVTGAAVWAKPFKFFVSIGLYALTLSWLIALVPPGSQRVRRLLWWAGTLTALLLVVEQVIIVAAAVAGTTSHFNVSNPVSAALWSVMGMSISGLWVVALVVAVVLLRARIVDVARATAVRSGLLIALVGMALGFLMTMPNASQIAEPYGVVGAHTVGVPDGGPGLPLLGWSTEGGDLRIGHFVGMHALQAVPLLLVGLELLATRVSVLADVGVRRRLVLVGAGGWLAVTVLLTVQALRGQSVIAPDVWSLLAGAGVGVGLVVAAALVLRPGVPGVPRTGAPGSPRAGVPGVRRTGGGQS